MKKVLCSLLLTAALLAAVLIPAAALEDGTYAVNYELSTETGIQKCLLPARLVVKDGENYVQLVFNDAEVDKLYVDGEELLPVDETKSGYRNDIGTYQVFELPLPAFGREVPFSLHTRGNNLVLDDYTITVQDYDEDFDADAQAEEVRLDNLGAQEYRFYDWHVGMSFSVWGPFVLLAVVIVAVLVFWKKFEQEQ